MKFDVINNEVRDFPELEHILDNTKIKDAEEILKWACIRYDPKCQPVQRIDGHEGRTKKALDLAGTPSRIAKQIIKMESRKRDVEEIVCMYFRALNNDLWEEYVSNQIAIEQFLARLRSPIDPDMDDDKELRAFTLKAKISEQVRDMNKRNTKILEELTKDDPDANSKIKSRKTWVTPEEYARS